MMDGMNIMARVVELGQRKVCSSLYTIDEDPGLVLCELGFCDPEDPGEPVGDTVEFWAYAPEDAEDELYKRLHLWHRLGMRVNAGELSAVESPGQDIVNMYDPELLNIENYSSVGGVVDAVRRAGYVLRKMVELVQQLDDLGMLPVITPELDWNK